ncbi:MAG: sigma-70 family RNA polymerase sigma factor [Candidatus Margulisiibacteriota bacterium]
MKNQIKNQEINIVELQKKEVFLKTRKEPKISEQFIVEHISTVESIASMIISGSKTPPGVTYHDLVSWGVEGLIKAKNNFNADKGTQFKTYAYYRIRGEILDKLRQEWYYRNPTDYKQQQEKIQRRIAEVTEEALGSDTVGSIREIEGKVNDLIANSAVVYLLSLEDIDSVSKIEGTGGDPAIEVIEEVDRDESHSLLWEEINRLTKEERKLVELFYLKDQKQKEIAKIMNLSRSKVCRMHMKILERLRRRLEKRLELDG